MGTRLPDLSFPAQFGIGKSLDEPGGTYDNASQPEIEK